nr:hypothetical protein [Tanacetum cinerariifolium]
MLEIVLVSKFKVEALQVKYPLIDWEIHSEGSRTYWKIIKVGEITQANQSFEDMLKDFNKEDLDALERPSIVKWSHDPNPKHKGTINEEDLFGVHDLSGDEVFVDVTDGKNAKDKGKGIMVEPEKPLKMKDQIALDEEVARKLEAEIKDEMEEEERIAKEKVEANIAMIIKSFKEVQQAFNKTMEWVNNFVAVDSKSVNDRAVESSKRAGKELEQESAKKQKLDEQVQAIVVDDDTTKLKRCLKIVLKDDNVTVKATPLSSKSPTIVDYKIYKEGKKSYFKIIRADRNSQNYLTFRMMFKNFNREDLEVLRSIVKERFKKTKPVDDMDNLLFQTLKIMFEHHIKDNLWKYQQGAVKVHNWKLFDSYGVYCVTTKNMVYYLLLEKMYPFTKNILHQLWKDVRL